MKEINRTYELGNLALNPQRIWDDPDYEERVHRQKRKQIEENRSRRRAHKHNMRAGKLTGFFFCSGLLIIMGMMFSFIYMQNEAAKYKTEIANMEKELAKVNTQNDAKLSRIETATNLNEIKSRAVNDLGMVVATKDHIVYYEAPTKDYLSLY